MDEQFAYIGVRIISQLKKLGLKQADLCRETGLSTTAISQYCTGKRIPDTASLYKMATVLKTSMEWLLTGESLTTESLTNEKSTCDGIPLVESEADLIAMFRLLDEKGRETAFDFVTMLYEKATGEKASIYSTYTDTSKPQKSDPASGGNTKSGTA
jgi:transcriptional regulator with XRE-family HTH domain